ncbi:hypothetical protein Fmac_021436 [Flemingia macrophylla]|uniref:C-JID domain-containing protein n=1 Tax=Flemingia macrophylla TaxID=520843 RepID=A0ABD1LWV3_9FABA
MYKNYADPSVHCSLESVDLSGCSKLLNNGLLKKPREAEHLENVDENRSAIQLSTSSVYEILKLPLYLLPSRKQEDSLHLLLPYLSRFPCLEYLDLSFCNLFQIPDSIGSLQSLISLNLGGNKFARLPTTIKDLSSLCEFNLNHCMQLTYLPELPAIKEKTSARYYRELYVFNCPKLSEMAHNYRMFFSWMIRLFKAFLKPSLSLGKIQIVIPGAQIPRWFSNQNVGSSIKMDLSSVMDDPNWMGVACCALLAAHDDPTNLNDKWQVDYHGDIGYNFPDLLPNQYWVLPILLNNDLVTGGIDHLFILFASPEHIISDQSRYKGEMHDLDKMVFETKIYEHPKGLHLEVKNCGYRTVYKKDLQQFNLNMMFSGNFSSNKLKLLSSD